MNQLTAEPVAAHSLATLTKGESLVLLAELRLGLTWQHVLSKDTQILLHALV
jgi:hypothetical protein